MTHQNPKIEDAMTSKTVEFHADDDAWYSVSVQMSGGTLTVKYCNFPDLFNERFSVNRLNSLKEVEDFGERFRPVSVQLQDSECRKVIVGVMVCASITFKKEDIRFYDAIVEEVEYRQHSFDKGDEECTCEFMLFWLHGPKAGQLTSASVETICLIQPSIQIDPVVTAFLKKCWDKVKCTSASASASLMSKVNVSNDGANQDSAHSVKFCNKYRPKEIKCTKQKAPEGLSPYAVTRVSIPGEWTIEDVDLGGEACFMKKCKVNATKHFVLIDNLEKNLSQSTLMEFLRTQTGISAEVFVLPSLSSETSTRGVVVVDSQVKLEKLRSFLGNPGHLIMSSRGRPWVISEICSMANTFGMSMAATMDPKSQKKASKDNIRNHEEIRIVLPGSEEYTKAKKVKDLVTSFLERQKLLHARLDSEAGKFL